MHPLHREAEQILKASERAASLTRQLLIFSRKQIAELRPVDLSALVADIEPMLRRLLGDRIDLEVLAAAPVGRVRGDPGQLEQVLLNLAVNARDAMPEGGRFVLEVADVELDDAYCRPRVDVVPGPYVRLRASDDGHGIDPRTLPHIFEPFFTTKGPGRGSGLGLSTVYGIVRHSGGYIDVSSQPDRGTTFEILLPRLDGAGRAPAVASGPVARPVLGSETILLAEDEELVRSLAVDLLKGSGYTVLEAPNGLEALRLAEQHAGNIGLLLTDVVMPGMNGLELAERLLRLRPRIRVLYTSGYLDQSLLPDGVDQLGPAFLHKPFRPEALLQRVRELLDAPPSASPPQDATPPAGGQAQGAGPVSAG
jgi:CheY-like chemotaxis protein